MVVAVAPAAARAEGAVEDARVAVVRLTFDGAVSEAARELFAQRLGEGLAAAQFKVLPRANVRNRLEASALAAEVASCRGGACMARAAAALDVAFLVVGAVEEREKTYEITLEIVNGRTGSTIGTSRERCEICGVEEATEKVGLAASSLRARLEALVHTPARFVIRSRPAGARLSIDGMRVGRTPVDHELAAGTHRLVLSAPGYDALERTITAVSGVDETLDLDLVPLPTKFPYRAAGATALAVGALALAGGVWALVTDGKQVACGADEQDGGGHCRYVWDTRVLGAALVGAGAAAATLGGIWLYFGSAGSPRAGEGGGSVAVGGVRGTF